MWQHGGSMGYSKKSLAWKNEHRRAHHDLELIAEELGYVREAIGELQDTLFEVSASIAQGVELLQAYLVLTPFPEPTYYNDPPPPQYELSSNGLTAYYIEKERNGDLPF